MCITRMYTMWYRYPREYFRKHRIRISIVYYYIVTIYIIYARNNYIVKYYCPNIISLLFYYDNNNIILRECVRFMRAYCFHNKVEHIYIMCLYVYRTCTRVSFYTWKILRLCTCKNNTETSWWLSVVIEYCPNILLLFCVQSLDDLQ